MRTRCWLPVVACIIVLTALLTAPAAMTGAERGPGGARDVVLSRGWVHYELTEPAECPTPTSCPLVVLVAGYAVPMVVWDDTVEALRLKGFRVLRFDFYGRGGSARPRDADYSPTYFADQIWELITSDKLEDLKLPRRFHVVASSMGGAVAAVFANRHPDAPDRVVLVSPAGLSVRFPRVTTLLKAPGLGKWYFDFRFRDIMLEHLQDNLHRDVHFYPKVLREFRNQLEWPGTSDAMYWTLRRTVLQDLTVEFHGLGDLRRPTLVLWGDEDKVVPVQKSLPALQRAIPHLEFEKIKDAAHLPQLEQPKTFNKCLTEFLLR